MENTKQKKVPLFAEVNISKEDARANKNRYIGGFHFPYLKLTYPNGVSLTLPTDIGTEQLERFIRIKL
ncbi:MAG: hypothetical protein IKP89_02845 [Bacteroidales bacterium]|nr:hypothetical protein [Bacteroidales bacterium]